MVVRTLSGPQQQLTSTEMARSEPLQERVERFILGPSRPDELRLLLRECVADGSLAALHCVARLYEDMYGGFTFNIELKAPASRTLLVWKDTGLRALVEAAQRNPTSKNVSIALQLLATVAAGDKLPTLGEVHDKPVDDAIRTAVEGTRDLAMRAHSHLVDLILSFPDDDEVAGFVGQVLSTFSFERPTAARELFAAVSKRWLAVYLLLYLKAAHYKLTYIRKLARDHK